jgi:uncharacterized protein YjeT (DUF2065 family)
MKILIYAIGIAMFIEGVPYLALPKQAKGAAKMLSEMSENALRIIGGVLVFLGFLILYLI